MRLRSLALTLVALAVLVGPLAATAAGQNLPTERTVTLRVAPEGFLVPSHYLVGNPAVWIVDPAETTTFNGQAGIAGCNLTVPEGKDDRVNGTEVLEKAVAEGCITGWNSERFACCGELVTSVDGRAKHGPTESGWPGAWWLIQKNGQAAPTGVSGMSLEDGDALSFVYYTGP